MIDTVQLVLLFVIVILTILLVVLGVQVFFILRELRRSIGKANRVLDEAGEISKNISAPLSSLSSLTTGLGAGSILTALKVVKAFLSKDKEDTDKKSHKE